MAPLALSEALSSVVAALSKRDYCDSYYYYDDDCHRSAWESWGRWAFAAVVVVFFIILFVIWGCINSRRRRRNGIHPLYGTGWMAPPPKYPGGPNQHYPPPPAYNAPPQQPVYTGTSFNTANGYYGHHEGIQMSPQPPANTYHRPANGMRDGQDDFAPPAGPPPGK